MKELLLGCWLVVTSVVAVAATYEETFTPKAGKAYSEDINVWVYTSEFAKRFGMPEAWIDDGLKGAYALAFRVHMRGNKTMFPHKGPDVNMPIRDCIFDVYIPSDANISWADGRESARFYSTPYSPTYLAPQSQEDRIWRSRAVGIESPGKKARAPLLQLNGGTLQIREYDRELYSGVTYISFDMGCMEPPKRPSLLEFCADELWEGARCHALHEVHIPGDYMLKLHGQWHERAGAGAAKQWLDIINK